MGLKKRKKNLTATQMALVRRLIRAQDTSAVREGEISLAKAAAKRLKTRKIKKRVGAAGLRRKKR